MKQATIAENSYYRVDACFATIYRLFWRRWKLDYVRGNWFAMYIWILYVYVHNIAEHWDSGVYANGLCREENKGRRL